MCILHVYIHVKLKHAINYCRVITVICKKLQVDIKDIPLLRLTLIINVPRCLLQGSLPQNFYLTFISFFELNKNDTRDMKENCILNVTRV